MCSNNSNIVLFNFSISSNGFDTPPPGDSKLLLLVFNVEVLNSSCFSRLKESGIRLFISLSAIGDLSDLL